ncbi:AMSH-like ubiquitin thioesterase 1 isoform X3 [Cornus florida]|uniref:AMSH-like ubiquitin thioesterase 1 isoform X3 n=1 Tax=Cornus florida TaxID=4283 RepID=UPI00289A1890|nr:AMSH-like ubiquitin thioesterase 1 isoform X3 [Cornus florida]
MRSSSEGINIAARTQKLDVDNRISLRFYYRIADNVLRQADIFRREKNIIDLYVMLMRFSSLVSETIPCHRDYKASRQSNTNFLMKKLLDALNELEELKPAVQQKLDELNRKHVYQVNGWGHIHQNSSFDSSLELYPIKKQTATSHNITKTPQPAAQKFVHQGLKTQQFLYAKPVEEQFRRFLQQPVENGVLIRKDSSNSEHERSSLESILPVNDENQTCHVEEDLSLISFETIETPTQIDIIRQPSPPPVLADVQDLIPASSLVTDAANVMENPSPDGLVCSEPPLQLHISTKLMDSFMKMARSNTDKNLETCGVLAGSLKNRKFYVTTLIIPKQESTSDSCQTTNEEEIFEVQDKQSLFPLGWIHTHPTQSCFMSSIDVHTHYSYQIMLPESIAIVMAPRDSSSSSRNCRTHGIFRLTNPGGMTVIRQCPRRGFHPHDPPADGGPIYKQCSDVYMNPDLKFDVVDLR